MRPWDTAKKPQTPLKSRPVKATRAHGPFRGLGEHVITDRLARAGQLLSRNDKSRFDRVRNAWQPESPARGVNQKIVNSKHLFLLLFALHAGLRLLALRLPMTLRLLGEHFGIFKISLCQSVSAWANNWLNVSNNDAGMITPSFCISASISWRLQSLPVFVPGHPVLARYRLLRFLFFHLIFQIIINVIFAFI